MKKMLHILPVIYLLLSFFHLVQAQTPKPSFSDGWYYILNGEKALEVVANGKNDRVRLSKKKKSANQLWKLIRIGEDEVTSYYHLTNQWLGKGKTLTVFEKQEGISLKVVDIYGKDADVTDLTRQSWVVMYANDELQDEGGYILLCITPMSYLTYKQGKFTLGFSEIPQANEIWRFLLVQ